VAEDVKRGFLGVAFAHPDYRRLLIALAISTAGDWIYSVALIAYVFDETHSPAWVGAATILRLTPFLLFGVFAGVVADRYDRRLVMIVSDLVRAAAMFGLTLVVASGAPVALALALTFLSTAAGTPYGPALSALTPAVVRERDLAAANGLMSSIEHVALVVGPAIGAVLLGIGSPASAFAINGLTFIASGILVMRVHKSIDVRADGEAEVTLKDRVIQGFKAVASSSEVMMLSILIAAATFIYGGELVVLVLVSERLLGLGTEGIGILTAAIGVGGVAAAGLTSRLADSDRPGLVVAGAVLATGLPLSLLAVVTEPVVACVLLAIGGAGSIVLEVVCLTSLQRVVDDDVLARVFGLIDSLSVAAILVGSTVTPILVEFVGLKPTLVILGTTLLVIVAACLPKLRTVDRATATRRSVMAPRVSLLDRVGVFNGAPTQTLETVARSMHERLAPAGTDIVHEGDAAQEFFVIESGQLDVLSTGEDGSGPRRVNQLGAGDYFGEIGLIEGIPRTATVRATTDVRLYSIPGEVFLELVNQAPASSATLLDGVISRLARTHPSRTPSVAPLGDAQ
jgi:MFS family permease